MQQKRKMLFKILLWSWLYSKKQDEILRNLNAKICANTNRKLMYLIWRTTTFLNFSRGFPGFVVWPLFGCCFLSFCLFLSPFLVRFCCVFLHVFVCFCCYFSCLGLRLFVFVVVVCSRFFSKFVLVCFVACLVFSISCVFCFCFLLFSFGVFDFDVCGFLRFCGFFFLCFA